MAKQRGATRFVPIADAAAILGVSVDTVRRWEKTGKITASRSAGGHRLFDVEQLEVFKENQGYSITHAAAKLGVSVSTLRRWEKEGRISPQRDAKGNRIFTAQQIKELESGAPPVASKKAAPVVSRHHFAQDSVVFTPSSTRAASPFEQETAITIPTITPSLKPVTAPVTPKIQAVPPVKRENNTKLYTAKNKKPSRAYAVAAALVLLLISSIAAGSVKQLFTPSGGGSGQGGGPVAVLPASAESSNEGRVLALVSEDAEEFFEVNVPAYFNEGASTTSLAVGQLQMIPGIEVIDAQGVSVDFGDGEVTASNLVYTVQGQRGNVTFTAGEGIEISGTTITNTALGTTQNAITGFTDGTNTIEADAADDQITLTAGTNITITLDEADDAITIAAKEYDAGADLVVDENGIFTLDGTLDTISAINLTGEAALNGVGSIDGTTESTFESVLDISGDVSGEGLSNVVIGDEKVLKRHVKTTNVAVDGYCLTYDSVTGDFEWNQCVSSGTINSLTLAGDSGTSQTLSDGDTITIAGGNGVVTTAGATDTVTIGLDLLDSTDGTGSSSTNSGLELSGASSNELSLLQGCNDGQVLKWNDTSHLWYCANDVSDTGGSTLWTISDGTTTQVVDEGDTVLFADSSTIEFEVTAPDTVSANVADDSIDGDQLADAVTLDGSSLAFDDGTNTLLTITDAGTTGNLSITGDLTVAGDDITLGTNTSGYILLADGTNFSPVAVSGDVGIAANGATTIQANAVALGTDTSGNYVATIEDAGNGFFDITGSGTETASITIDIADDSLTTTQIADSTIQEIDLEATNTATDNYILSYDSATGGFTWIPDDTGSDTFTSIQSDGVAVSTGAPTLDFDSTHFTLSESPADDFDITIADNGIALGTKTIGNYTATIADAGNSTITVTNGSTEGGAVTLDVVDVNCTDCLNATEIEDIYVLNSGDTLTGELVFYNTATSASTSEGAVYYDTDDDNLYVYANGSWVDLTQQDTDTNTTYSAGDDLDLTGTTFSLETTLDVVATINLAGTGTLNGLDAIDSTTESTLEAALDIGGDVVGTGLSNVAIATGAVGSDELASTAVTPGSYTNANVTVDADGRITSASNGTDNDTTYTAGTGLALTGTEFSLSHLGIESLTDPNADRIFFWDDSSGTAAWLAVDGTTLAITGTTLAVPDNGIALGTKTTGNYVATIADAGNSTVSITNGSGEGGAATIDVIDLNCTDCLNATEIEDIYVLNTGDTVTGDLALANQSDIRLNEASINGVHYTGFQAPASLAANLVYTLPESVGGNDYVLTAQTDGTLAWVEVTGVTGAGDITAVGDVTSGAAFDGTQGTELIFNDADGDGTLTIADLSAARTYTFPDATGTVCLTSGNCAGVGGTGDVVGPASSTDNAIARFDSTTGKLIQNSGVTIDDSNNLVVGGDLTVSGDDITLGTNTSGYILVADGTNFNPVDASGDVDIASNGALTIQSNAVALGTDTTGNYVATIADAGSSLITVANSGSESAAVTLTIANDSLDFAQFQDILDLDASLIVNTGGNNVVFNEDGANSDFRIEGDTNSTLFFTDASNDSVGIGTNATTSTERLVVRGAAAGASARFTDATNSTFYISHPVGGAVTFGLGGTTQSFDFRNNEPGTGTSLLYLTGSTGNVGVNDSSPDAKLEVLSTSEQLRLTHTDGTVDSRFTVDASGNLAIDNTGTKTTISDALEVTGALTANGNVTLGNANTDTLTINAGSDGSGISFGDASFQSCVLTTNASGVLTCGSDTSGATTFTLAGDTGSSQTIGNGDTLSILTGSHLTATTSATDTVTLTLDDDTLDFAQFQDTLDLDAALVLNQGTNTWTQNFTGTTGNGVTLVGDSLTTGELLTLTSNSSSTSARSILNIINDNSASTNAVGLNIQQDSVADAINIVSTNASTLSGAQTGIDITVTDTGNVTTSVDTTRGLVIAVNRSGATGGSILSHGFMVDVTATTGGNSTARGGDITVTGADSNRGLEVDAQGGTNQALGLLVTSYGGSGMAGSFNHEDDTSGNLYYAEIGSFDTGAAGYFDTWLEGSQELITATLASDTGTGLEVTSPVNVDTANIVSENTAFTNSVLVLQANEEDTGSFNFLELISDADGTPDTELTINQDGDITTDGAATIAGTSTFNGNTVIGNANTDTLTINAGSDGSGISFGDASFQSCVLTTNASGVLTCGSDTSGATTFTLAGDTGSSQTIGNGDTLSILTDGHLTATASATDTVTISLDDDTIDGTELADNITLDANLNFDSNTLVIDSTNNRVGVGTASPGTDFVVADADGPETSIIALNVAAGPQIQIGSTSDYSEYLIIGAYNGDNNIDTKTRDFRIFSTSDSTGLNYLASSGNLGIGDSSPDAKLDVSTDNATTNAVTDVLILEHTSSGTPAAGLGTGLAFHVEDAGGSEEQGSIDVSLSDVTDASEDAIITLSGNVAGAITELVHFDGTESVINDASLDMDFRVEGNGDANLLFVDAGADAVNVGTNSVSNAGKLRIADTINWSSVGTGPKLSFHRNDSGEVLSRIGGVVTGGTGETGLYFDTGYNGSIATTMVLDHNGRLGIGDSSPDAKLEVLSTSEQLRLTHTDGTVDSRFTVDASGNLSIDNTGTKTTIADALEVTGALTANGNVTIGNANTDTLTINAGSTGSGITFADASFQTCTLKTSAAGVLTCGTDSEGDVPDFDEVYAQSISNGNLTMEIDNASGLTYNLNSTGNFQIQHDGTTFAGFNDGAVIDFGDANSFAIPNGTAPTVDEAGEVAVDTTDGQFKYHDGTAERVLTYQKKFSSVLESPSDSDNFNLFKAPYGLTITDIQCVVDPGDSSESVVIDIQERDATADNPASVDATITCDNDGAEDDGALSNGTIDSGDWISLDVGTVTGTVNQVTVTVTYTVDGT